MKPSILLACLILSACEFPEEREARVLAQFEDRFEICRRAQLKPVIEFERGLPVIEGCR